jgi:hypothetical protein
LFFQVSGAAGANIISARVFIQTSDVGASALRLTSQSVTDAEGQFMDIVQTSNAAIELTPLTVSGGGVFGRPQEFEAAFRNVYFENPGPRIDVPLVSVVFEVGGAFL